MIVLIDKSKLKKSEYLKKGLFGYKFNFIYYLIFFNNRKVCEKLSFLN